MSCPFCTPAAEHVFLRHRLVTGIWDAYPVSPGHVLLVTTRHVGTWFESTSEERQALVEAIESARDVIQAKHQPDGFNIGVNIGSAAGQTIGHLHLHVIPRYAGDVPDPRGGIRGVIPGAAVYGETSQVAEGGAAPHARSLVAGGTDPLLPHLVSLLPSAVELDINVAFTLRSGVDRITPHLRELVGRGGRLRILTGDYLNATDPVALRLLLDLQSAFGPDRVVLRVFETRGVSFHPKSYIVRDRAGRATAFVGSSNLSFTALESGGIEWNYRLVTPADATGIGDVMQGFEALFADPRTRELSPEWIAAYEQRRLLTPIVESGVPFEPLVIPPPHRIQAAALDALVKSRASGARAGLVVMATGLGKTWLSAFDTDRSEFPRVLFVAHREEILGQAMATFRCIRPKANLGRYDGTEKSPDADVLFASIQTLGRSAHLTRFSPERFDYIVVDEFHHAAAASYRHLIDHFRPRFLLGLTATPERTDGGDLLALCGESLVYRCDLVDGIRAGLLSPFDYFGVPDDVDYSNIPWRNSRFDETELTSAVTTRRRAENAIDQLRRRGGSRAIAFCVSQRHAEFMAEFFREQGLRAAAVHAGPTSAPRALSLEQLEKGELDVICAVDMFNEGVDLPNVDTILMLRPTESRIVWLQQFGRGLRFLRNKRLRVIDYIGNHRAFLLKPRTLLGLPAGDAELRAALEMLQQGTFDLPPGCSVTYELEAKQIIEALLRGTAGDALRAYYTDFVEREGVRPVAVEAYHDGFDPAQAKRSHGSWLGFIRTMGGLEGDTAGAYEAHRDFLGALEVTEMTKSYKMLVLGGMVAEGAIPEALPIAALGAAVRRFASRYPLLDRELREAAPDEAALVSLLERNPIEAWVGGKGTGRSFFRYAGGSFAYVETVERGHAEALRELIRETVDWRLASYTRRLAGAAPSTTPSTGSEAGPVVGATYQRAETTPLFGVPFNEGYRMPGVIPLYEKNVVILLVTLDKRGMQKEHRYADRFESRDVFVWQSQNKTGPDDKMGGIIAGHERLGYEFHLFVRREQRHDGRTAPFVYCGPLRFVSTTGAKPMTVKWRLVEPLSVEVARRLGV